MAVEHRDRPRLAGERMLYRELRGLDCGDRVVRLHDVLRDAAEGAARVPAAPVAGRLLIGRVQCKARRIAEIGQEQHRRARQMSLDRAEKPVAEHPWALPEQHTRPLCQPEMPKTISIPASSRTRATSAFAGVSSVSIGSIVIAFSSLACGSTELASSAGGRQCPGCRKTEVANGTEPDRSWPASSG